MNNQTLFNGAIYENIVIGRSIEKDSLNWILESLGLIDYIKSLDDGLETKIGPSGIRIQGSNIQKLIFSSSSYY